MLRSRNQQVDISGRDPFTLAASPVRLRQSSPRGRAGARTRPVSACVLVLAACLLIPYVSAEPIAVRYPEGAVHAFLNLRAVDAPIATTGDMVQQVRGDRIESRMVFRFKDGSLHDETAVFTQQRVLALQSYRLVQRGPAFMEDLEVSLERSGSYNVKSRPRGKSEKAYSGSLDLPDDVYNGMVLAAVKNLPRGVSRTVSAVAFTPKPRVIGLELVPLNEEKIAVGNALRPTTHYAMKPKLGPILGLFASAVGKKPPSFESWFVMDEVPAFVRFEGPLYVKGHIWRIELTVPSPAK